MEKFFLTVAAVLLVATGTAMAQSKAPPSGKPSWAVTLDSLKANFTASQIRIEAERDIQKKNALTAYGAALEAALQALKGTGDLDGVLALQQEEQRFYKEKTILEPGGSGRPALLEKAILDYTEAVKKAERAKDERSLVLTQKYVGQLDELTKKLVMADKIDEATKVRETADIIRMGTAEASVTSVGNVSLPVKLTILEAKYGVPGRVIDITSSVIDMVENDRLTIQANDDFGDPAIDVNKTLTIRYKYSGTSEREKSCRQPETIEIYPDEKNFSPAPPKKECPNCHNTGRCQNSRCVNGKITRVKIGGKTEESPCPICNGSNRCNKCTN